MSSYAAFVEFRGPTAHHGDRWLVRLPAPSAPVVVRRIIPRGYGLPEADDIRRAVREALLATWGPEYAPAGPVYVVPHQGFREGAYVVPFHRNT